MGIDIRSIFQKKHDGHWTDVLSDYDNDRDYLLYRWLYHGGSDADGSCAIEPIRPQRGLPADFEVVDDYWHPLRGEGGNPTLGPLRLMGEWGHSWLLAEEILDTPAPRVTRTASIPIDEYRAWDGQSEPPWQWICNGWGHAVGAPDKITEQADVVVLEWNYDFTEDFRYFVDEVRRLKDLHGELRFIFGFA